MALGKYTYNGTLSQKAESTSKIIGIIDFCIWAVLTVDADLNPYEHQVPSGCYDEFTVTVKGIYTSYIGGKKRADMYEMQFVCYRTASNVMGESITSYVKEVYFNFE